MADLAHDQLCHSDEHGILFANDEGGRYVASLAELISRYGKATGHRLSETDARIVIYCIERAGQPCRARDIFRELGLDRPETYKRLDRLIRAGLVHDVSFPWTPMRLTKAVEYRPDVWEATREARIEELDEMLGQIKQLLNNID